MTRDSTRTALVLYALLTLPFLVNDLANIFVHDFAIWLLIDYAWARPCPWPCWPSACTRAC